MTYHSQAVDRLAKAILAAALADATRNASSQAVREVRLWCLTVGTEWADTIGDGLCGEMIRDLRRRGWRRVGYVECEEMEMMK